MSYRYLSAATVLLVVLAAFAAPAAGQGDRLYSGAPTGLDGLLPPAEGELPQTPWGDPDLRGVWNNSTETPMERMTEAEKERDQLARQAVIAATQGTGAAWIERSGTMIREALVVDPPDGRIPELLPAAKQRLIERENAREGRGEADSWLDRNSWERCISRTMPVAMIPNGYNANYQILQTPDYVAILIEMIHESRIIPLDGRPHVDDGVRQWLGDSRGRWEGNTLVVETERFNDRLDGGDYQPSHIIQTGHRGSGGTLRLVERFTMRDANSIDYELTIEDLEIYTRPYTLSIPMTRRDTEGNQLNHLFEYACHEGNHGMMNLLSGGRADEQQALEAAARVSRQRKEAGHPGIREPAVPFLAEE